MKDPANIAARVSKGERSRFLEMPVRFRALLPGDTDFFTPCGNPDSVLMYRLSRAPEVQRRDAQEVFAETLDGANGPARIVAARIHALHGGVRIHVVRFLSVERSQSRVERGKNVSSAAHDDQRRG
jgi:hypothetical protein